MKRKTKGYFKKLFKENFNLDCFVDNDVNIMFNSNNIKPKENVQFNNDNFIKSGTNNTPTVRQYINNVHKKTLISMD